MAADLCARCGANLALVGRAHRCVPWADAPAIASPPVANSVANGKRAMTSTERAARWRAKNRERYNSGQRELMRKRRAAARAT